MTNQLDYAVLQFFGSIHTGWLDPVVKAVTFLGDAGWIWILSAAILLCFRRTRRGGAAMALALLIGFAVCNLTLKPLVARVRPFDAYDLSLIIPPPSGWSFPSGHACSSFAASVSAGLTLKGRYRLMTVLAGLIALSRLYLQVHYFTDVLAGAVIGSLAALAAYAAVARLSKSGIM